MKKAILSLFVLAAVTFSTFAAGDVYETTIADYDQTTQQATLDLIWSFKLTELKGVTCAVITGVKNSSGTAHPSGALTVPTSVRLSDTGSGYIVKKIADGAFTNQIGVTSISLPVTIQEIGSGVFVGCTVLADITVADDNPWFSSMDGLLYDKDRQVLLACPATKESVSLPSSLTTIAATSFANCHRLTALTIPASVEVIGPKVLTDCALLESITFKGNAPTADTAFCDNPEDVIIYKEATSTGWNAVPWTLFKDIRNTTADASSKVLTGTSGQVTWHYRIVDGCAELYNNGESVIPAGTTETLSYDAESKTYISDGTLKLPTSLGGYTIARIGARAFTGCAVTSLVIPSTVTVIDDYAFENCRGLEEITLPSGLTELGVSPFSGSGIASLALPPSLDTLRGNPVAGCLNLDTITVDAKNRNFIAVDNVLYNRKKNKLYGVQTFFEALTVPATVAWVASNALASCTMLTNVTFEGNAPVLQDGGVSLYANVDADLITRVTEGTTGWNGNSTSSELPADSLWPLAGTNRRKIAAIEAAPIEDGTGTETIDGVTWTYEISDGIAIVHSAEPTTAGDVKVPSTIKGSPVTTIGNDFSILFGNADMATGVIIPSSVTNISSWAFKDCSSLAFVDLTETTNLQSIGSLAFAGCSMLTTIEIPNSCSIIGDKAFSSCNSLVDVILPDKMISLGGLAFWGCTLLQSIKMPSSLTGISRLTFFNCSSLQSITLPNDLKTIAQYAFESCSSLKKITLPKTLSNLGAYSFYDCTSLTDVTFEGGIPSGLKNSHILDHVTNVNCPEEMTDSYKNWLTENGYTCTINNIGEPESELKTDGIWYYHIVNGYAELWCTNGPGDFVCALANPNTVGSLELPASLGDYPVKSIAPLALSNLSGIKTITFAADSSYERIGAYAFSNCTSLASITIPYGVRSIGTRAFMNTIIQNLELPDSIINLDGNIAAGALFDLGNALVDSSHFLVTEDGAVYNRDQTKLYACPTRLEGTLVLPESLTEIGSDAFFGCFRLTYLNLPESVATIGDNAFNVSGIWPSLEAPEATAKLLSVFYNGDEPAVSETIYTGAPAELKSYVPGSWGYARGDTWKARPVELIDGATHPVLSTTDSDKITWYYHIVDGQAELYNNGKAAIEPKTTPGVLYTSSEDDTSTKARGLKIPVSINGYTVRSIGDHAFDGCTGLTTIGIPDTVETIGDYAFANCTAMKSIDYVIYVPFECSDGSINLPYGVTKLGSHAFDGTKLLTINLPTTLKEIDGNPFAGCEFLTTVTVDAANPKFAVVNGVLCDKRKTKVVGVPANIDATSVSIPSTIKTIGEEAFLGCVGLDSIDLSDSVTAISSRAFANCTGLTKLTVPANTTSLGSNVFSDCANLVKITYLGNQPTTPDDLYAGTPEELTSYANAETEGWTGDSWKDRPLVITAKDPESDFLFETDASGVTWSYHLLENGTAEICSPDGTAVASDTPILSLSLPATLGRYVVKSIGTNAFANLPGLTAIDIPSTYESIGDNAFANCTSLADVTIPSGIRTIGRAAFSGTAVTSLALPASVRSLDGNPGVGATELREFTVDENNPTFASVDGLLYDKDISTLLACPALATEITLPATVTALAADAFADCAYLTKITALGDEPTADDAIFAATPDTLTTCADTFTTQWTEPSAKVWKSRGFVNTSSGQSGVTTVTDDAGCAWTYTVDGTKVSLGAYGETPVIPNTTAGEITVPEKLSNRTVTEIPEAAFVGCGLVTKITIPASVTNIAATAFNGCTSLVEIAVSTDNPSFASQYRCLYSKDGKTLVRVPAATRFAAEQTKTISHATKNLVEIVGEIDESTGLQAANTIITKGTSGKATTTTTAYSFTPAITTAQLFAGVTAIADYAFADCGRLTEGTVASGSLTTKENGKLVSTQTGTFTIPFSTDLTGSAATTNNLSTSAGFYSGKVCFYRKSDIESVTYETDVPLVIPATVSTVAETAFENAHFTSVSQQKPALTGALTLTRVSGTSDVYVPLTEGAKLVFYVGINQQIDLTVANDLSGALNTVTAKGLPTGLKLVKTPLKNAKKTVTNYVYSIAGAPTRVQASKPVTLTVSNKYKWTGSLNFEVEVLALPNWVAGAYSGVRYDTASNAYGAASATITTLGKLSGKFLVPSDDLKSGKTYSFAAATLTAYDAETKSFRGTATLKIGRETAALPFSISQADDGTGFLEIETEDGFAALVQNIWNRKDLSAPTYVKGSKVTLDGITYKFAAKGVVSWTGKLEGDNGKTVSVSGTSQLLNDNSLLLYIPPKSNLVGGLCEIVVLP